jgi:hypothetical protein
MCCFPAASLEVSAQDPALFSCRSPQQRRAHFLSLPIFLASIIVVQTVRFPNAFAISQFVHVIGRLDGPIDRHDRAGIVHRSRRAFPARFGIHPANQEFLKPSDLRGGDLDGFLEHPPVGARHAGRLNGGALVPPVVLEWLICRRCGCRRCGCHT